jgi:multimeric flavodoxin WrbA
MTKYLLISGSPRKGNTDFALQRIHDALPGEKELVFLRDHNILHCKGCSLCHHSPRCIIKDGMEDILGKMLDSDVIILGTPNYFDNVSGIMKDFIDRTHPCYKPESLAGKKLFLIMTGGEKVKGTRKYLAETTFGFVKYQKLDLCGSYCFSADKAGDLQKSQESMEMLGSAIAKIKSINNS